ncbi:MAG: histidine phosphatase family protein [Pseudomonadota bacterium]
MTLTLIVLRHAKSDWGQGVADHDRPLNARGQRDAPKIGQWLAQQGYVPQDAAVSSARRTRQTWAAIADMLPQGAIEHVIDPLYEASVGRIMAVARATQVPTRAIVGHNPGIGTFMHEIVADTPDHPRFLDIPTGATLVVRFDAPDWSAIDWRQGQALAFVTPHDL